jgi:light-regulated signal transduction histidine kinase (bacteriophytochrome)
VLVNLLSNAFKFTQSVPEQANFAPGEVTYSIRDNGAGFDMLHAGRLFSSFQRLHRESEFEGTGLSLAIMQRILERHGETISAHLIYVIVIFLTGSEGAGRTPDSLQPPRSRRL